MLGLVGVIGLSGERSRAALRDMVALDVRSTNLHVGRRASRPSGGEATAVVRGRSLWTEAQGRLRRGLAGEEVYPVAHSQTSS